MKKQTHEATWPHKKPFCLFALLLCCLVTPQEAVLPCCFVSTCCFVASCPFCLVAPRPLACCFAPPTHLVKNPFGLVALLFHVLPRCIMSPTHLVLLLSSVFRLSLESLSCNCHLSPTQDSSTPKPPNPNTNPHTPKPDV
jgi:hypothetical protein